MEVWSFVWFYWPGTVALVAALASSHLYVLARSAGRTPSGSLAVAITAVASAAVVVVPLMVALRPGCSDSHFIKFNPAAGVVGLMGVAAWLGVIVLLYRAVGAPWSVAQKWPVIYLAVLAAGAVIEFFVSTVAIEVSCHGANTPLFAHLAVAFLIAVVAGVARVMPHAVHQRGA